MDVLWPLSVCYHFAETISSICFLANTTTEHGSDFIDINLFFVQLLSLCTFFIKPMTLQPECDCRNFICYVLFMITARIFVTMRPVVVLIVLYLLKLKFYSCLFVHILLTSIYELLVNIVSCLSKNIFVAVAKWWIGNSRNIFAD